MKIEEVKKLGPLERFLYWIRERHNIYLRRRAGRPKPWTDDEVFQTVFFTNPYREHDKVTVWFRENIREPLRDDPRVLFATVCFRWFNLPSTAMRLGYHPGEDWDWSAEHNMFINWDADEVLWRLKAVREQKQQVFTGAYMINSPGGEPKLEAIIRRIDNAHKKLNKNAVPWCSLEEAHAELTTLDGMGGFMAYEVVCDLRYTYLLENAPDKMTWCHVGPGARRGLYRVLGLDFPKGDNAAGCPRLMSEKDELKEMRNLLKIMQKRLRGMPPFEMREIEHICCETDKYNRALDGDGKLKRKYNGKV